MYKHALEDVKGQRSLESYSSIEGREVIVQEMRDCGLNNEEITLWLKHENKSPAEPQVCTGDMLDILRIIFVTTVLSR